MVAKSIFSLDRRVSEPQQTTGVSLFLQHTSLVSVPTGCVLLNLIPVG